ncbi:amino acid adenylation domain-containing protein [Streptomyces sp. NPDC047737]|uniref:amino acid adenylation domain-containing protein n=1 Tax=unclassified Streptomyces TaxID=2593676 RepID=UPI0033E3236E
MSGVTSLGDLRLLPGAAEAARAGALRNPLPVDTASAVLDHVARHAGTDGDRAAVVHGDTVVTYRGLLERVGAIRAGLLGKGCGPGDVVAVTGLRCPDIIAVLLATESLAAVYLPVDPGWPPARVSDVLTRGAARWLVDCTPSATGPVREAAARAGVEPVPLPGRTAASGGPPAAAAGDRSREPRYAIFTSGTTGRPKGALVEHQGMMNHLWAKVLDLSLDHDDTVAFSAPLVFDIAVWQMLAPLLAGGTVAVIDDADLAFPRRLTRALSRSRVSVVELVPTVLGWLVDQVARTGPDALAGLRWVISTGEELRPALARRVVAGLPRARLLNAYGPTECSDDVTHQVVGAPEAALERLPVGSPVVNAVLHVLAGEGDGRWRAAAEGEPGELFVGGLPVGLGYLNDEATTRAAFFRDVIDPGSPTGRLYRTGDLARVADGRVHYLGRADRQVKVSGVRMELDEVEVVLSRHPAVGSCAVVVSGTDGSAELTAHYSPRGPVSDDELKEHLRSRLPAAMVPGRWRSWEALPLTRNGKTDHRALRDADAAADAGQGAAP